MPSGYKFVIADDHPLFRGALKQALSGLSSAATVLEAGDFKSAKALVAGHDDIDLVLEGHTDAIGTEAYNQDLSRRRVEAVKAKLAQDYGIPAGRISTQAYGESRPIADNSTAEGRQRNRRVVGQLSYVEVMPE